MKNVQTGTRKRSLLAYYIKRDKSLLMMVALPVLWYIIFCYVPMYGVFIAFMDYKPALGMIKAHGLEFIGLKPFFIHLCRQGGFDVIILNLLRLIFDFPAPIILALLLNELKLRRFKKAVQTISYMPHFISAVVVVGMVMTFLSPGHCKCIPQKLGHEPIHL